MPFDPTNKPGNAARPGLIALIREGEVCRCLRSKKIFYQTEAEESEAASGAPFWCQLTQTVIGPDRQIVGLDHCRPGRSCCEAT